MSEKTVEIISLNNRLEVEVRDLSRILAGDRWLVRLEARAEIPLAREHFDSLPEKEMAFSGLEKALGPRIPYRYTRERHFVAQNDKDPIFHEFLAVFKENVLPYLRHPEFARRFVLSRYRDLKKKDPRLFASR